MPVRTVHERTCLFEWPDMSRPPLTRPAPTGGATARRGDARSCGEPPQAWFADHGQHVGVRRAPSQLPLCGDGPDAAGGRHDEGAELAPDRGRLLRRFAAGLVVV